MTSATMPVMPDLVRITRLFRHDVWSATATLAAIGVDPGRVVLEYAGGGWDEGSVVEQSPAPGSDIGAASRIVLRVGGTGTLESLPFPLREDSPTGEMRIDRVCAVLDVPLLRGRAHVRSAGAHFRLTPNDPLTARRWIEDVMGLSSTPWPEAHWYRVARLLSSLPFIAGRHDSVAIALQFVYGLPVERVFERTGRLALEPMLATRLGVRNGRLGVDAVAGDGLLWQSTLEVVIGPVPLDTYLAHVPLAEGRAAIFRLVTPAYLTGGVVERWIVRPRAEGFRLGDRSAPPLLGVSSYVHGNGAPIHQESQ